MFEKYEASYVTKSVYFRSENIKKIEEKVDKIFVFENTIRLTVVLA